MREILGVYTESIFTAREVRLKRSVVHTTTFPDGRGFASEAFDKAYEASRRVTILGLVSPIPLPAKKTPFRDLLSEEEIVKRRSDSHLRVGDSLRPIKCAPPQSPLSFIAGGV